ncbi:MAG: polysaccharide biosynthesis tyrosine autokinase [Deltaproteobacteria bacterium]|nr:polysaccharide biosynthesis tyrosine autokinase [Deltaproteobacteria bacterium]
MSDHQIIRGNRGTVAALAGNGGSANGAGSEHEFVLPRGAAAEPEADLHYYWRLVYGRRWLLLATAMLGLAIATVTTFRQPRLYVAQATVEFKPALAPGKDLDILGRTVALPPELAKRLLSTKILAARVINTERTNGQAAFAPPANGGESRNVLAAAWAGIGSAISSAANLARVMLAPAAAAPADDAAAEPKQWDGVALNTINMYYAHTAVVPVRGTSLADIVVTHSDPVLAARIANLHAQTFIDMDVETKVASLSDAQGLLGRQLKEVRERLENSRAALTDYQLKHGILNLPKDSGTLTRQSLQQLNTLLTEAQGERIVAEAAYRNAAGMTLAQLGATLPDKGLQSVREEILSQEARYRADMRNFGANHPDMIALRARIEAMSGQLETAAGESRGRLRAVFEAARAKEDELRSSLQKISLAASNEDRELVQLSILQRDVDSNEQLYGTLLGQAKEVDLTSGAYQWTNVKLVDRAVAPSVPSYPRTSRNLMFGLLLGLLGGALGCVLIERLDTTVNTPDDIVAVLDLPAFGMIPDFQRLPAAASHGRSLVDAAQVDAAGRELVTLLQPASLVSEAYRSVRTNLMFSSPDNPPKCVLITSSQPDEGKTVTVINLAVTLVLSGSRVLVVDADLRKPSCHTALRVDREPGLSNVLTGRAELQQAIVRSPLSPQLWSSQNGCGLFVLPAGRVPPNPAELLGSHKMTALLEQLKEQFDFVLVDSPPIIPVTDSVVIATKVDGVLMVVRGGEWGRDVISKALAQLTAVRAHLLGAVLNSVNVTRGGYSYYYYRHYYGYGAHYGKAYGAAYGQPAEPEGTPS